MKTQFNFFEKSDYVIPIKTTFFCPPLFPIHQSFKAIREVFIQSKVIAGVRIVSDQDDEKKLLLIYINPGIIIKNSTNRFSVGTEFSGTDLKPAIPELITNKKTSEENYVFFFPFHLPAKHKWDQQTITNI